MQMKIKHVQDDLLRADVMYYHGYSSREIWYMSTHQLMALYNVIFEPIDVGDIYTLAEDVYEEDDTTTSSLCRRAS